jgi:Rha family phage regulatory protein
MTNEVNNLVSLNTNNQIITTSKNIAAFFGKRHADVLRDIDNTIPFLSEEYGKSNFAFTTQNVAMPKGAQRQDRICELTKNGAIILILGYTGKDAMQFKEAYINAFDAMYETFQNAKNEKLLHLEQQNLTLSTELATYKNKISSAQAKTLKQTVEQAAKGCKKAYSFIYHAMYDKFEIPDYKSLPADKYNDCMSFVAGILIPANALKIDAKENLLEQNKTTFFADLKNFVDEILQDLKRLSNTSYLNSTEAAHQKNQIENKLCIIKALGSTFS